MRKLDVEQLLKKLYRPGSYTSRITNTGSNPLASSEEAEGEETREGLIEMLHCMNVLKE